MFIFLERDTFEAKSEGTGATVRWGQVAEPEKVAIRRPYRGIQIKDDTYAVLSVRRPDGSPIPLVSSSAPGDRDRVVGETYDYSDFILQQVTDQRVEKQQIIETFGDAFVYFFGERPRMLTFQGQLMNTEDFNWRAQFWHNYDQNFRGSRLVQNNARCYLAYDTIVIEGYPISAVAVDDADNPYQVSFQMTMLMTDYHEYSTIGETRFPVGAGASSLEVLNQELEERRKGFTSTTVAVRRANLAGSTSDQLPGAVGILGVIRAGISSWNTAASWLGDKLQTVNNLIGGRSMRIPIGAASYLQLVNEAEIASASITTSSSVSFNTKTGGLFGTITVNGVVIPGNKLLVMGPSKFAPMWKSDTAGMPPGRGFIHENSDEYPTRAEASSLMNLLKPDQYPKQLAKEAERIAKMTAFQQQLAIYNVFAAQGSVLGTVASIVSSVRQGYGMLLTAVSVTSDPRGMLGGALGVTTQDVERMGAGLKDGAFIPGVSAFVGGAARKTWEGWISDLIGRPEELRAVGLGSVYGASEYQSNVAGDPDKKSYDSVYGASDYTPLLESRRTAEAEALISQGQAAEVGTADSIEKTLDEVYGDTDSASYGSNSEDEAALEEVYGQGGTIKKTTPTAGERQKMLEETYNGDAPPNDTDTSGITAEDADSALIDPVV